MSFLTKIGFVETEGQEAARLAEAPEGSLTHALSKLPVTISGWPEDLLIELPWAATERGSGHRVVIVPFRYHNDARPVGVEEPTPRRRHGGWWDCIVVASTHPSYPVGGYRLSISAAEIARGRQIDQGQLLAIEPAAEGAV